jgi:hypothetical protein
VRRRRARALALPAAIKPKKQREDEKLQKMEKE